MQDLYNLRTLIAEGKISQVFKLLLEILKDKPDLLNQCILLSSEYKRAHKNETLGLTNTSDIVKKYSQINLAVLEILNQIENGLNSTKTELYKKTVFISYSHQDSKIAYQLRESLIKENINVIIDIEDMEAGSSIEKFIKESIHRSHLTLSIISKNSLYSSWVAMETAQSVQADKPSDAHKFIACYTENSFLEKQFTDEALDYIESEIKQIQDMVADRMEHNRSIRDLQDDLNRYTLLRNNLDDLIGRLKGSLCIDLRADLYKNGLSKILKAI